MPTDRDECCEHPTLKLELVGEDIGTGIRISICIDLSTGIEGGVQAACKNTTTLAVPRKHTGTMTAPWCARRESRERCAM